MNAAVAALAKRRYAPAALGLLSFVGVLVIVELLIRVNVINRFIVPMPSDIIAAFPRVILEEDVLHRFVLTATEAFSASILVTIFGVAGGVLLYRYHLLRLATETWVAAVAAAPLVLAYPLYLVIFGRSALTIVMMGFSAGLAPIILKTLEGLAGTRRVLINVGRSFNLTPSQQFWKILFPAALPTIFVGLRLGLIFALINIVGVEFLINFGGLGQLINELAERYDLPGTYAAICFVILVSVCVFVSVGKARAMAETGRLTLPVTTKPFWSRIDPVTQLRIAIIVAVVVIWEAVSASGLLYRDVVPSLTAIGKSLYETLADPTFYFHLYTTFYEIGIAMVIGGVTGLAVGILLGGSKFMSRAYEAYLYYLGPCPKIIFFPIMIMWFGVGPGSKVAMGAISCFFPVALNVAGGMREIDKVLIRVGKSFRLNTWQMVTKIYLPAMRHPVINGVRLGLGRRADRHAARRNQALEQGHRLPGHPGLQHLQHAADVCAADHPVRDRDRRQLDHRPGGRPR